MQGHYLTCWRFVYVFFITTQLLMSLSSVLISAASTAVYSFQIATNYLIIINIKVPFQ
jgi:hypothetical protein